MIQPRNPRAHSDFLQMFAAGAEAAYTTATMQKLYSRSQFADLAGVNASTITRLAGTSLAAACAGKKIDAAHPAAVAYLAHRNTEPEQSPATGLDPLYEQAILSCQDSGRWTASFLQRHLRIGYNRAVKLIASLRANGVAPEGQTEPAPVKARPGPPPDPEKPRGQAAVKIGKKRAPQADHVFEVPEEIEAFADMTLRELIDKFGTDVRFVDWLKATQTIEAINEKRLKNAKERGELVARRLVKIGILDPIESAHIKLLTDGARTMALRSCSMRDAGRSVEDVEAFVKDQITSFLRPIKPKVARVLADGEN